MRIVHGEFSGRKISLPKSLRARPTTDQAKEALFNILMHRFSLPELSVLDLFSGTGSISYEFASLGCQRIIAVEKDRYHVAAIQNNSLILGASGIQVVLSDVFHFIERSSAQFDIIFADPPYDLPSLAEIPDNILHAGLLKHQGVLILEHGSKHSFKQHSHFTETRKYGKVHFSFFSL